MRKALWCAPAAWLLTIGAVFTAEPNAELSDGSKPARAASEAAETPFKRSATILASAAQRYAEPGSAETPDFQKHVLPVLGKLGCNGRSCHGSFQGAGGFRLSLFGYDFKADHDALLKPDGEKETRVNVEEPEASKMIRKATLKSPHKGGQRLKPDSWEYNLLMRWVESGAKPAAEKTQFKDLVVAPSEIVFENAGQTLQIRVTAVWSDGSVEDVTCMSRFRSNDDSIAVVDESGVVKSLGKGDTHIVAFYDNGVEPIAALLPVSEKTGERYPASPTPTKIDKLVAVKLKKLGVEPSPVCTDVEFLRRVSLDLAGTLPTPKEIESFIADKRVDKRKKKIDELLESPPYAAWWTTKLCDTTGQNLNQMIENFPEFSRGQYSAWYEWFYVRVKENVAYDKIVEGVVLAKSREAGESYEDFVQAMSKLAQNDKSVDFAKREHMPFYWARRNVQKPEEKALNFAYAFLGVRLQCAECHKHPFDQWTQTDFKQFTAFFNQVVFNYSPEGQKHQKQFAEKYDLNDPKKKNNRDRQEAFKQAIKSGEGAPVREVFLAKGRGGQRPQAKGANRKAAAAGRVITPKVLGGEEFVEAQFSDPREPLMDWMRSRGNPYFSKAFVNRVWANYFNVGIIEPPDDMNLANPPSNPALLDYLATGFMDSGYDMKWLHREICNSDAYQRSWQTNPTNVLDTRNFSRAIVRRLPAEVAYDALVNATANADDLVRSRLEINLRAIGNPMPTGAGRRGENAFALKIFGKPDRAVSCDCERMNEPTLVQSLYLRNDNDVRNMLHRKSGWLAAVAIASGQKLDAPTPAAPTGGKNVRPGQADRGNTASVEKQIEALEKRIARMKQQERPADQTASAEKQLARLRSQQKDEQTAARLVPIAGDMDLLIREAYLRTLSRPPTSEETVIAQTYIKESRSPIAGLRDLIWVLVNTREFITNH